MSNRVLQTETGISVNIGSEEYIFLWQRLSKVLAMRCITNAIFINRLFSNQPNPCAVLRMF